MPEACFDLSKRGIFAIVDRELPDDVRNFVAQNIASVEQLEILLRLFEARERTWTVSDLNREIRSQESSIAHWLGVLVSLHLVSAEEARYCFAPGSPELERQSSRLVACYRERRVKVIELIFAKPKDSLMNFARAFDFRKRP